MGSDGRSSRRRRTRMRACDSETDASHFDTVSRPIVARLTSRRGLGGSS